MSFFACCTIATEVARLGRARREEKPIIQLSPTAGPERGTLPCNHPPPSTLFFFVSVSSPPVHPPFALVRGESSLSKIQGPWVLDFFPEGGLKVDLLLVVICVSCYCIKESSKPFVHNPMRLLLPLLVLAISKDFPLFFLNHPELTHFPRLLRPPS